MSKHLEGAALYLLEQLSNQNGETLNALATLHLDEVDQCELCEYFADEHEDNLEAVHRAIARNPNASDALLRKLVDLAAGYPGDFGLLLELVQNNPNASEETSRLACDLDNYGDDNGEAPLESKPTFDNSEILDKSRLVEFFLSLPQAEIVQEDVFAFDVESTDGRKQKLFAYFQGDWLRIDSPFARRKKLSADKALESAGPFFGAAAVGELFVVRNSLLLDGLRTEVLKESLGMVAAQADIMEKKFSKEDQF
jgi:hypothetical protein